MSIISKNWVDTTLMPGHRNDGSFTTAGVTAISNIETVNITDENGEIKTLESAEVARLYSDAMAYRRILRFASIFSEVKDLYRELLTLIQLMDPLNEEELLKLEKEIRADNKDTMNGK